MYIIVCEFEPTALFTLGLRGEWLAKWANHPVLEKIFLFIFGIVFVFFYYKSFVQIFQSNQKKCRGMS